MSNKLVLDCFEVDNFSLVGINSSLQIYRLIYLINKKLEISFERLDVDLDFKFNAGLANFPIYLYFSEDYKAKVYFIANKSKLQLFHKLSTGTLFEDTPQHTLKYLMPELKEIDFLLKIEEENEVINLKTILYDLNSIQQIEAAFEIGQDRIKHPQNLIVE